MATDQLELPRAEALATQLGRCNPISAVVVQEVVERARPGALAAEQPVGELAEHVLSFIGSDGPQETCLAVLRIPGEPGG